ncbi:MAG TPA: DUF2127 domain-containing protein [Acidimicrobiales bacterium]|nr:DUF2127 domain-containing protein [Acidimicrobiales bacterium]
MKRARHSSHATNRYELFTCGWDGHVLVGTDAAHVSGADPVIVREIDGVRWFHCLRCYAWVPVGYPEVPGREAVPTRDEIELPLRGRLLRDRYVLRLIACDRAVHVAVFSVLAVIIFFVAGDHAALERDYAQIVNAFGGPSQPHPFLGQFKHFLKISSSHLYEAGAVVVAYGVLEATEMVGLWFAKRWAEYLTFVATVALIPFEVYELISSISILKLVTFVINVAIAAYLLWSKRLFGLNGGHAAEDERLRAAVSWESVEKTLTSPPSR